ncbi:MAG: hypothetical protein H7832_06040 [Magnetococcus sp. DMHC-6]
MSVFQCRLSRRQMVMLRGEVLEIIKTGEDHLLLMDLGPADRVDLLVSSIGKPFEPLDRDPVIV